ncbi:MAG TPA: MATE family efflux transporter [Methanocorpusculum sp.]|nr:MATE family efflux transporter [Methanocorpusculum sp.]HJJ54370.1 MATE family efflux transporter [Methanocorpusculum sp.]HKL97693.1 MATE family efflux transporter [Methanocorpusculum sp.]
MTMKITSNSLTEGPVGKALLIVALPIIISNLLQSILEVVDMYFIGKLGDVSIAGGTMGIMVIMVLTTVIFGVVTATAAFVSRAYGSKKYDRISVILLHAMYLALAFSAIIAVIGLFFSEKLLLLMGAELDVAAEGARFLTPMLMGLVVMVILATLTTVFQSTGDSRTPMYVMLGVNVVNIALNPALIEGFAFIPAFGIAGSAYASLASRAVGVALLLGVMYLLPSRKDSPITFPKKWTFEPKLIKDIVVIAIPSAIQSGIRSAAFLLMTAIIAIYGTAAVAAYGICLRLDMMGLIIVMGLCTGVAVMVGQNLGAGKVERAVKAVRYAAVTNAVFMIIVAAVYLIFAKEFLMFFGATGESLADGILFMQIVPLSYFIIALAMTMGFAMNGAGMTRPGMYSAIAGQLVVQVGLSAFFALNGYPIEFIWYAAVTGTIIMFIFDLFFYMRGGWKTKKLQIESDILPSE